MTDLTPLVEALKSLDAPPSVLWKLLFVVLLISPNLASLATHGTTDLLAAHGYTMEQWIEERRAS